MTREDALAMLQALPPGTTFELKISNVRTPTEVRRPKTSAERMAEKRRRDRELEERDDTPSQNVTSGVESDESDGESDDVRNRGDQGGSGSDQSSEAGKREEIPEFKLTSQDPGTDRKVTSDATKSDASPSPARKPRRAPAKTRLPEPFDLSAEHLKYSRSKGWPDWWVRNRHGAFLELAKSKGWTYADWDTALQGFLRREVEEYGRGPKELAHLAPTGWEPPPRAINGHRPRQPYLEQQERERKEQHRRAVGELEAKGIALEQSVRNLKALSAGIGDG